MQFSVPRALPQAVASADAWIAGAIVVLALLLLEDSSRQVTWHPLSGCLVWPLLIVLVIAYLTRAWRRLERGFGRWPSWLPLCALLLLGTAVIDPWPMRARFSLSRDAFERVLARHQAGETMCWPAWVGLYWVDHVWRQIVGPWYATED